MRRDCLQILAVLLAFGGGSAAAEEPAAVDYNRDIRPILSDRCYACHGPDEAKRQAGLRLDQREAALAALESEGHAIVPGASDQSKLIERVASDDDALRMPPAEAGERLTADEIDKLRRWIDTGAIWKGHWSYLPLEQPPAAAVTDTTWARTPIDDFILRRLEAEGPKPMPEADRTTLIRRVSFDLTGLPPTLGLCRPAQPGWAQDQDDEIDLEQSGGGCQNPGPAGRAERQCAA
jgi:hypothetical protein